MDRKSSTVSYGHDIEAAWLLLEAAETINDESLTGRSEGYRIKISLAAAEGIDTDGGLWYEYEQASAIW
jgi:mannobiose 2-epimerase